VLVPGLKAVLIAAATDLLTRFYPEAREIFLVERRVT
jgi:hypothetical protein